MAEPKQPADPPPTPLSPQHVREIGDRMRAQLALGDDRAFRWLFDRQSFDNTSRSWRPEILGELGRLVQERGKEVMRAVATQLCDERPATSQALATIRQARSTPGQGQSTASLTTAVAAAVGEFRSSHPGVQRQAIIAALEGAIVQLREGDES